MGRNGMEPGRLVTLPHADSLNGTDVRTLNALFQHALAGNTRVNDRCQVRGG